MAFGFLAAFAEAAAIGGLADWYAVVALFRRPLGLPIPHTAIIPANQLKIAEKLGEFVERNFLDAAPIEAKLRSVDFASFVADWLADSKRSAELARFVVKLLPEAVDAAENSGVRELSRAAGRRPPAGARSGPARRRHVSLVRARRPPSLAARRPPGCDPQVDQRAEDAGRHSRKNPRRAADHPALLPRRCLRDEEGRRIRHGVLRGRAHRSRASVPRRVRPADPVVRRKTRDRAALRQPDRRVQARAAGAARDRPARAEPVERRARHRCEERERRERRAAAASWQRLRRDRPAACGRCRHARRRSIRAWWWC